MAQKLSFGNKPWEIPRHLDLATDFDKSNLYLKGNFQGGPKELSRQENGNLRLATPEISRFATPFGKFLPQA